MKWLRSIALYTLLAAAAAPSLASRGPPPWWRSPIPQQSFSFAGEITSTVLRDGQWVDAGNDIPAGWLGAEIRGTFEVLPNFAEGGDIGPRGFSWTDGNPEYQRGGVWLTLSVTNPDGSRFSIQNEGIQMGGPDNTGKIETDDGWLTEAPQSRPTFSLDRTFNNGVSEKSFHLDLAGVLGNWWEQTMVSYPYPAEDMGALPMIQLLEIDPSQATHTNAGFISQSGPGGDYAYGFRLTRFVHLPPVPEPETWALMVLGVGVVGAAARRRQRTAA